MRVAGLCGSDLHSYRRPAALPAADLKIPGHEPSGIVESVGSCVTRVRPGDRVSVFHYRGCGHCKHCRAGYIQWCAERRGYGGPIHGSCADLLLTDERNCLTLPDDLTFVHGAAIACFLGTAYAALRKLSPSGEDTLAVFGQGPVGMAGVLVGRAMGARTIAVEPIAERRALSQRLGSDLVLDPGDDDASDMIRQATRGEGADLVFETAGSAAAQDAAVACLRRGGRGVFVGFGNAEPTFNLARIIGDQLTLMGSFVMPIFMYWDLVEFIRAQRLPVEDTVTHRFPIEQGPEAFEVFEGGRTGKVVLEWSE
jgi:threonine dehydrogenase-like Zn-dependent dehydrogenase